MTGRRQEFSRSQLSALNSKKNLHLLIYGNVYDVHEFVNGHPGGDLVLVGEAGKDATKAFEDVQHSDDAMKDYLVGYCSELSQTSPQYNTLGQTASRRKESILSGLQNLSFLLLLSICLVLLLGLYWNLFGGLY